jgi:hypothetical protein
MAAAAGNGLFGGMIQAIVFQEGAIEIDARLIAHGLGLDVAALQEQMPKSPTHVTSLGDKFGRPNSQNMAFRTWRPIETNVTA